MYLLIDKHSEGKYIQFLLFAIRLYIQESEGILRIKPPSHIY